MIAVVMPSGFLSPEWFWLTVALSVAALGGGPLVSWFVASRAQTRRLVVATAVALLLGAGIVVAQPICCAGCDPWWLEHFWICVTTPPPVPIDVVRPTLY